MRILVVGGGGREHAIGWKLVNEGHTVFASPGNPGLEGCGVPSLATQDYVAAAESVNAELTVVGPEAPLVAGVVDKFRARGLAIVGPDSEQAQLEGSKIKAKEFMAEAGIPTARSEHVRTVDGALQCLSRFDLPVVVKADGLAAGKGVVIAHTRRDAEDAIRALGPDLVVEEFLTGEEVSFIALCDGQSALPFETTQDHKALYDNDEGPNTGGMGAYCDGRILTAHLRDQILESVIQPVVERTKFTGFLYAGLILTSDGPKVLEFNVRLGDPETQALMHRMKGNFGEILAAAAGGRLAGHSFDWKSEPSICVVLAAAGYPGKVRTGDPIHVPENCGADVFHAGTKIGGRGLETAGGRVLGVTSQGPTLAEAIENTYAAVRRVHFDGVQFRTDVGSKGLKRW